MALTLSAIASYTSSGSFAVLGTAQIDQASACFVSHDGAQVLEPVARPIDGHREGRYERFRPLGTAEGRGVFETPRKKLPRLCCGFPEVMLQGVVCDIVDAKEVQRTHSRTVFLRGSPCLMPKEVRPVEPKPVESVSS